MSEHASHWETTYGPFHGGDPREFTPDEEVCTPDELAHWTAVVAAWNYGDRTELAPGCATLGDGSVWDGSGLGMGTTRSWCERGELCMYDDADEEETA